MTLCGHVSERSFELAKISNFSQCFLSVLKRQLTHICTSNVVAVRNTKQ